MFELHNSSMTSMILMVMIMMMMKMMMMMRRRRRRRGRRGRVVAAFGFEEIGSVGDVLDLDDLVLEVRVVLHVRDRAHVVHVRQVEELRLGRVALRAAETVAREAHVSAGSSPRPRTNSPSSTR